MEANILESVKKPLMIPSGYDVYDLDVMTYINTAFANLYQIGVGPDDGFRLEDGDEEWAAFIDIDGGGNANLLGLVKTYIILVARMNFDPPTIGFLIDLKKEQLREYEWRIAEMQETDDYIPTYESEEV